MNTVWIEDQTSSNTKDAVMVSTIIQDPHIDVLFKRATIDMGLSEDANIIIINTSEVTIIVMSTIMWGDGVQSPTRN